MSFMRAIRTGPETDSKRHLTAMYSETKQSYETITEPPKVDVRPEIVPLHRKLREQKKRLIQWGFDWSDTSAAQPGEIDETLAEVGLTEIVMTVLLRIKNILKEAEQMKSSTKTNSALSSHREKQEKLGGGTVTETWTADDVPRAQELLAQLTSAINELPKPKLERWRLLPARLEKRAGSEGVQASSRRQELSTLPAARSSLFFGGVAPVKPASSTSSRFDSVARIDLSALDLPDPVMSDPLPPYETIATPFNAREIGRLRQPMRNPASAHPWQKDLPPMSTIPVLIEYASLDPIYSSTGVHPSLSRLEALADALRDTEDSPRLSDTRILDLLGYFECPKYARYGLVYALPPTVLTGLGERLPSLDRIVPLTLFSALQSSNSSNNSAVPNLEDRMHLACSLATTFLRLHEKSVTHRDVTSSNIIFFRSRHPTVSAAGHRFAVDLRQPYLTSFDLFSELDMDENGSKQAAHIYRHLHDIRLGNDNPYRPAFDIHGLGMILLEIGLWMPLSSFYKRSYDLRTFQHRIRNIYVKKLGQKCGSAYMRAVESCLSAADRESDLLRQGLTPNVQWRFYCEVVNRLERCCALAEDDERSVPPSLDKSLPALPSPGIAETPDVPTTPAKSPFIAELPGSTDIQEGSAESLLQAPADLSFPSSTCVLSSGRPGEDSTLSTPRQPPAFQSEQYYATLEDPLLRPSRASRSEIYSPRYLFGGSSRIHSVGGYSRIHSVTLDDPLLPASRSEIYSPRYLSIGHSRIHSVTLDDPLLHPSPASRWEEYSRIHSVTLDDPLLHPSPASRWEDYPVTLDDPLLRPSSPSDSLPKAPTPASKPGRATAKKAPAVRRMSASPSDAEDSAHEDYAGLKDRQDRARSAPVGSPAPPASSDGGAVSGRPRARLRVVPVKLVRTQLDEWHKILLPRVERLLEKALSSSIETFTIDLIGVVEPGGTPETAKATILVTCTSVGKVKGVLDRHLRYNRATFSLKVRKGKLQRSCAKCPTKGPKRMDPDGLVPCDSDGEDVSTDGKDESSDDDDDDPRVMNPFHQHRPLCGASIGAYNARTEKHQTAVSYGGVVLVDGVPFGMTVHHLLDDSESEDEDERAPPTNPPRSSGVSRSARERSQIFELSAQPEDSWLDPGAVDEAYLTDSADEEDAQEAEEDEYEWSIHEGSSDEDSSDKQEQEEEHDDRCTHFGDRDGLEPGRDHGFIVTQPAWDDVEQGFFEGNAESDSKYVNQKHLDAHRLGLVHASSGIRRWTRQRTTHEIDWALLKIDGSRLQPYNVVQGGRRYTRTLPPSYRPALIEPVSRHAQYSARDDVYPLAVARLDELPGLYVHSLGRTSGLRGGRISTAMSSVRVAGRRTPSRSYHVFGTFGVAGDSGAWVIDNQQGRVCGHVLAWCSRNRLAYICPMDILLEDMRYTLGAKTVELPVGVQPVPSDGPISRVGTTVSGLASLPPSPQAMQQRDPAVSSSGSAGASESEHGRRSHSWQSERPLFGSDKSGIRVQGRLRTGQMAKG